MTLEAAKYVDSEHGPYLRVHADEPGGYAIVTSKYLRAYCDGETADRIVAQVWKDGAVIQQRWDMDRRSLETMFPQLIVSRDAPDLEIEPSASCRFPLK
jgi:hypothetical protein